MRGLGKFRDNAQKLKPECPFCSHKNKLSWNSLYSHLWKFHMEKAKKILLEKLKYTTGNFYVDSYRILIYAQNNKVDDI